VGCTCNEDLTVCDPAQLTSAYYLRLVVADQPGVLAQVAGAFGEHDVSVASVIQKRLCGSGEAEIVWVTHEASEGSVRAALEQIRALDAVSSVAAVIRVEEL
jgi:homoserine dehydrogenase